MRILKFLSSMFGRSAPSQQLTFDILANRIPRIPQAGDKWILDSRDPSDPFEPKETFPPVEILEVKQGWVRYYMNRVLPDERMPIERFTQIYTYYKG